MKRIIAKWIPSALFVSIVVLSVLAFSGCAVRPMETESSELNQADESIQPQQEPETMADIPGTPLSKEELDQFNGIFATQADKSYCLPVNGFFTSFYDDATELDFVEFLRYYPDDSLLENEDAAEFEALSKLPDFPWNAEDFEEDILTVGILPTPTHRILRSSVDETLQNYAGITTKDLKNTEGVLYLPEYDAYYNFTSDFGPGVFECVGGKKDGNMVRLWSDTHGYDDSREILTLQEVDGNYYIKSFQSTNE